MSQAATIDITSLLERIDEIIEYLGELERGNYAGIAPGDTSKPEALLECAKFALERACKEMFERNFVTGDPESDEHNGEQRQPDSQNE